MSSSLTSCLGCRGLLTSLLPPVVTSSSTPFPATPSLPSCWGCSGPHCGSPGAEGPEWRVQPGQPQLVPHLGSCAPPLSPHPCRKHRALLLHPQNSFLLTPGAPDSCPELGNAKGLGWSGPRGGRTGVSKQRTRASRCAARADQHLLSLVVRLPILPLATVPDVLGERPILSPAWPRPGLRHPRKWPIRRGSSRLTQMCGWRVGHELWILGAPRLRRANEGPVEGGHGRIAPAQQGGCV